ncbi:MAG: DUF2199 domain-containing protein [Pseudomonadota bacterium]
MALVGKKDATFEFTCAVCGDTHRGAPSFCFREPPQIARLSDAEKDARVRLSDDLCRLRALGDGEEDAFFIRVTLEIPIHGSEAPFLWGVWVSQSAESFARYLKTFDDDQSGDSSFGWLVDTLPGYRRRTDNGALENLACDVFWGSERRRPTIRIQECDHPLFFDQRDGVSVERAIALAQLALHPRGAGSGDA